MLILVHEPGTLCRNASGRLVNTDAIRDIKPITIGCWYGYSFAAGSNSLITFRDGTTLKVTDSMQEFLEAKL